MKICIVGGGNLGTAMAVDFAEKNHTVNVLTSRPQAWQRKIFANKIIPNKLKCLHRRDKPLYCVVIDYFHYANSFLNAASNFSLSSVERTANRR